MNPMLKRLDQVAKDPLDPALGVTYSKRATAQREVPL